MRVRQLLVAVLAATMLLIALDGCAGKEGGTKKGAVTTVVIEDLRFNPSTVRIQEGEKVRWVNRDTTSAHTSTSKDFNMNGSNPPTAWNSKPLNPGSSWEHTFDTAGDFEYFCMVHPYMKGKVVVEAKR